MVRKVQLDSEGEGACNYAPSGLSLTDVFIDRKPNVHSRFFGLEKSLLGYSSLASQLEKPNLGSIDAA